MHYVILALIALILPYRASAENPPEPRVLKLNERVFALIGPEELPNSRNRGFVGNSTLIVGDKGSIVIDTGFTHELGMHLRRSIANTTSKPVTHVINTHPHGDHFLGNSAFAGAEIISSERCREIVVRDGRAAIALVERLTGIPSPDSKPVPATRTYAEATRTQVVIQGVKMELWVPKGSHTPGDLLVYLPDDGILITGDVATNGAIPNFRDGNVQAWIETLNEAQRLPFTTAIPGHGFPMTKADVQSMTSRMTSLYREVESGYRLGLTDSEIRKKMDLSAWQNLKRFDEMGMNISRVYLEVESKNF
jgi:cyclase